MSVSVLFVDPRGPYPRFGVDCCRVPHCASAPRGADMTRTGFTVRCGNAILIYVRGVLVAKHWDTGAMALFQIAPTQTMWL